MVIIENQENLGFGTWGNPGNAPGKNLVKLGFTRFGLAQNSQVRGGNPQVRRKPYKTRPDVVKSCRSIRDNLRNPLGTLKINLGKDLGETW